MNDHVRTELLGLVTAFQREMAPLTTADRADDSAPIEAVHRRYAARLDELFDRYGWPPRASIDADGAHALHTLLSHAIWVPDVYRRGVRLYAASPDADPLETATLEDRVRQLEGRPQRYGTHCIDWDDRGRLTILPVEGSRTEVDARRATLGLPPLDAVINHMVTALNNENDFAPAHVRGRLAAKQDAWAHQTGWR